MHSIRWCMRPSDPILLRMPACFLLSSYLCNACIISMQYNSWPCSHRLIEINSLIVHSSVPAKPAAKQALSTTTCMAFIISIISSENSQLNCFHQNLSIIYTTYILSNCTAGNPISLYLPSLKLWIFWMCVCVCNIQNCTCVASYLYIQTSTVNRNLSLFTPCVTENATLSY